MRVAVCALVAAVGLTAEPALAQPDHAARTFWKSVQATCNATAAKPPSELARRIAKTALDEFNGFDGHRIDSNGRLFRFGLTEAEHEEDDGGDRPTSVGHLGWWRVMKYWRALFGDNTTNDKIEVRGYDNASNSTQEKDSAAVIHTSAERLMRAAEAETDPEQREALREAALRAAIVDTPWSAAFISYVIRQAGVPANAFKFSNAHRVYIYDAFAASLAEQAHQPGEQAYRACPLTTKPRPGDVICAQREPKLTEASDEAVREGIREELTGGTDTRSVRRTHCEVVAYVDARARKVYSVGGNVNQGVGARKLNLRGDLKFAASQKGHCGGPGAWTLPEAHAADAAKTAAKCSLNDKKWFVLLQLR